MTKPTNETGVHEYVVSTGDTLSSILNQYGIDMGEYQPACGSG
ncbi:putative peptidase [Kluyvera cryocrescens]|uniref:Putative peptidase n=1 Tax=Kluyvera cryocrescens TaxID=580 RepID=A0A485A7Y7_KLUCR|nr:putative peptidase [Kluyvera cryocrescens]